MTQRATSAAEAQLSRHNPLDGWATITEQSHPATFEAFETIRHDAGHGAGHTNYSVEKEWATLLPFVEAVLSTISKEGIQDFAIGGEDQRELLMNKDIRFLVVDAFLTAFFSDWQNDGP